MTNGKRGRKPKYIHTIVLENLNARELYKKYKQSKRDSLDPNSITPILEYNSSNKTDLHPTQMFELNRKKSTNVFYDTNYVTSITMIDYVNYGCLPERTDLWCSHDHHPSTQVPLDFPLIMYAVESPRNPSFPMRKWTVRRYRKWIETIF